MTAHDKTGPKGQGPMTGCGCGMCAHQCGCGCGCGCMRGCGRGCGRCCGCGEVQTDEERLVELTDYANTLKEELEDTEKEIAKLSKTG